MASNEKAAARTVRQDAIGILAADHKKVGKIIFADFETTMDKDSTQRHA
ncbi:MAG TPA: hypothetical protein VF934_11515 [Burkholderiales bacterium]